MFNNAGVAVLGELEEVTLEDWDKTIDVNFRGVAHGTTIAYRQMLRQGHGHIVNTASVAGLLPVPLQARYCATKHAVLGLTKTAGLEAAQHDVAVTAFCPAFVESGMFDNHPLRGTLQGADARRLLPISPLSPAPPSGGSSAASNAGDHWSSPRSTGEPDGGWNAHPQP
jgi:NAD(P)-dependent dehydrogenase (short-subunit alcohol dehydrogenase family)